MRSADFSEDRIATGLTRLSIEQKASPGSLVYNCRVGLLFRKGAYFGVLYPSGKFSVKKNRDHKFKDNLHTYRSGFKTADQVQG